MVAIGDPKEVVPVLEDSLKDPELDSSAPACLATLPKAAKAVPALLKALRSKNVGVKKNAMKAIDKIGLNSP
ncbi:MAG: hypothetical protein P1V97_33420 [Planctomycetota bacterium]|nr:hypothetical protein [Planctomycetota bacterium]